MKHRPIRLHLFFASVTTAFFAVSLGVFAQQQGAEQLPMGQLTEQEQMEYRQRLGAASNDAERKAVEAEYRKTAQQRTRLQDGHGDGQAPGGANRHEGQKQGAPSKAGKAGPAGSQNKPQKSGK